MNIGPAPIRNPFFPSGLDGRPDLSRIDPVWQKWLLNLGADTDPGLIVIQAPSQAGDDTRAFQAAIDLAVNRGGAMIIIRSGTYHIGTVTIPAGESPIAIVGRGWSTIVQRRTDLAAGIGMFDIQGASNVSMQDFVIDGDTTAPAGLLYNGGFSTGLDLNDPMAASLTLNTSVWLHGPLSNFSMNRMLVRHTGGYGLLIDAQPGLITDVEVTGCRWENNRPNLFGVLAGQEDYGSWTGGIYVNGDGRFPGNNQVLKRFLVAQCRFLRNTGNCIWSHLYGLNELHQDFQFFDNYFQDCGLDAIEVGGVIGGAVTGNVFHRVGYVTLTDSDSSTPRWLADANATALDSSGLVKGVVYADNSFLSINGGCIDMDGHGDSVITGNVMRTPYSDEPEYVEDKIATSGPTNSGSATYGVNSNNSQNTPYGGANLAIVGNTFINLASGAIRLFAPRNCQAEANNIVAPDGSLNPPIILGPTGAGVNLRCTDNRIAHNKIHYSPGTPAPAVKEDPAVHAFTGADVNYVFGNCPITGDGLATEFSKDSLSGSPVYAETVWFP